MDWHRCKFLESSENLKPLVKRRFGREPNTSTAREIIACLQQGRLFYEAAEHSPIEIAPLQLFYGMVGFSKALIVASSLRPLSSLKPSHGVSDISVTTSRIADLRLKIGISGTFQEFNDVVANLTRVCYMDFRTNKGQTVYLPSARSSQLSGISISLQEILSRIPGLEALYEMTFGMEARTASMHIQTEHSEDGIQIQIEDDAIFSDLKSLKEIVDKWREKFPFLRRWRLEAAQYTWGRTAIQFENLPTESINEFSEEHGSCSEGDFRSIMQSKHGVQRFALKDGLESVAGNGSQLVSPVKGTDISEFSLQYLALYLLSSLVRYRPQIWAHALSRSSTGGQPADDKTLSLIGKFLNMNQSSIPELVINTLNPSEDYYNSYSELRDSL